MNIVKFDNISDFIGVSSDFLYREVAKSETVCRIGLCGGSTPKDVYVGFAERVSSDDFGSRLALYEIDERYVDRASDLRNTKMIMSAFSFFDDVDFSYFESSEFGSVYEVVEDYAHKIKGVVFDVCVVGIGPDGHIASLFPGFEDLNIDGDVAHTTTEVFDVKDRLTVSMDVVMKSKKIIVLMKGSSKEIVLKNWESGVLSVNKFPAMKLLEHEDVTVHYCLN